MTITVSRDEVTLGIAVVGAGLGIFNTWDRKRGQGYLQARL